MLRSSGLFPYRPLVLGAITFIRPPSSLGIVKRYKTTVYLHATACGPRVDDKEHMMMRIAKPSM